MTDKELDDIFKNAFASHEMPVPNDMWQRIQPTQEPKRRLLAWWVTAGSVAAITAIVVAALWWHPSADVSPKLADTFVAKEQPVISAKDEPAFMPSEEKDATAQQLDEKEYAPQTKMPGAPVETQPSANDMNNSLENSKTVNYLPPSERANIQPEKANERIASANSNTEMQTSTVDPNKLENKHKGNALAGALTTDKSNQSIAQRDSVAKQLEKQPSSVEALAKMSTDNQGIANNNTITGDNANAATDSSQSITAEAAAQNTTTPIIVRKTHGNRPVGISLLAGGYTGTRSVYAEQKTDMTSPVSLASYNPNAKTVMRGLGMQLRIDKPLNTHFSVISGLQYLVLQQSVSYLHETVNQYAVLNTVGFNTDTARYTQISFRRPVLRSAYNSINIPVLLSYHTEEGGLRFAATAGAVVNAFSWYSGDVPSADYKDVLKANEVYKTNSGVALYVSVQAGKSVGNWQLFAEPHIQIGLSSPTKPTAGFKQKTKAYGLSAGIRRQLIITHKQYR